MQKETLIGKRVAIWSEAFGSTYNGHTGEIVEVEAGKKYGNVFKVKLDKFDSLVFFENELYFPDSPLGYNQKCFNQ